MQRRRRRALLVMRKLLTCTMCSMALVAVLSVPVQVFPSSRDVSIFSRSYRLPTVITDLQFISYMFFLSRLFNLQRFLLLLFVSVAIFFFLLISYSCHCFLLMRGSLLLFGLLFILFGTRIDFINMYSISLLEYFFFLFCTLSS